MMSLHLILFVVLCYSVVLFIYRIQSQQENVCVTTLVKAELRVSVFLFNLDCLFII